MTEPKIPYREQNTPEQPRVSLEPNQGGIPPRWGRMLFDAVRNRHKIRDVLKGYKDDPNELYEGVGGLLGQYLLDKHTPQNLNINLKHKMMNYQFNNRFGMGYNRDDGTDYLNFNWRF